MFKKFMIAASALALSACATTTPEPVAEFDPTGPAMWVMQDDDTTIYLFGTVHILPEDTMWLHPTVQNALASSDQYVSEIDTSVIPDYDPASGQAPPTEIMEIAQMQIALATLQGGQTLRQLMEEDDRAEYEEAMTSLGLPVNAFDQFEPWFASMGMMQVAMQRAGLDPSDGVERVLDNMVEGKARHAFETVEMQMQFFDSMPMQSQLDFLDEGVEQLDEFNSPDNLFSRMVAEWTAGDPDGLAEIMNEGMDDEAIYTILLSNRNARWAEWLDARMDQPGTVFVAVGAGHLGGRDSVQDYLEARGFDVERVRY